jgi:hypothetical protein
VLQLTSPEAVDLIKAFAMLRYCGAGEAGIEAWKRRASAQSAFHPRCRHGEATRELKISALERDKLRKQPRDACENRQKSIPPAARRKSCVKSSLGNKQTLDY